MISANNSLEIIYRHEMSGTVTYVCDADKNTGQKLAPLLN